MSAPASHPPHSPLQAVLRDVHATLGELLLAADEQYAAAATGDHHRLEAITGRQERLAAAGVQLIVVFVRVGLVPDAGSLFFLTRMLGLSKAAELAITSDPLSAEDAHRLGLIAAVLPPEQLMAAAMERAQRLAEGPRQTYALIKRGMERALQLDLEQTLELESHLQGLAAETPDAQEAIRAFLEKRKPVFGG